MSTTDAQAFCMRCSIRTSLLQFFDQHVEGEDIGNFVDGLLDAAAIVAANHVIEGKEAKERTVLLDQLGKAYDRSLIGEGAVH